MMVMTYQVILTYISVNHILYASVWFECMIWMEISTQFLTKIWSWMKLHETCNAEFQEKAEDSRELTEDRCFLEQTIEPCVERTFLPDITFSLPLIKHNIFSFHILAADYQHKNLWQVKPVISMWFIKTKYHQLVLYGRITWSDQIIQLATTQATVLAIFTIVYVVDIFSKPVSLSILTVSSS